MSLKNILFLDPICSWGFLLPPCIALSGRNTFSLSENTTVIKATSQKSLHRRLSVKTANWNFPYGILIRYFAFISRIQRTCYTIKGSDMLLCKDHPVLQSTIR